LANDYLATPGKKFRLANFDPADSGGLSRLAAEATLLTHLKALEELHELLYVAGTHAVLIVLQGIDASGKDGTIRKVFSAFNPAGCRVVSFKAPSSLELAHDYLWRIHREAPAHGEIAIFNRSHYESVLVERIHRLVGKDLWSRRYDEINAFEQTLTRNNTIVLKFALIISPQEQLQRLRERMDDPTKWWKLNVSDWTDRAQRDEFEAAYEDMITKTSTDEAPWYVVPADRKWFRNLVIAQAVHERLDSMAGPWRKAIEETGRNRKEEVEAFLNGRKDTFVRKV
jgi:PPK2 family polyphosphate:nucleotide phosphotransferase